MAQVGSEWPKYVTNVIDVFVQGTICWEQFLYLRRLIKYVCHVADEH